MQKICVFTKTSRPASGLPSFHFNGYRGSVLGAKRLECEVNNSPPSSAEVKHKWSYTSLLPYALMASTATALPFTITMSLFYNIILKLSFKIRIVYTFGFGSSLEAFQLKLTTSMSFPLACYSYVHIMLHILIVLITWGELVLCGFINDHLLPFCSAQSPLQHSCVETLDLIKPIGVSSIEFFFLSASHRIVGFYSQPFSGL